MRRIPLKTINLPMKITPSKRQFNVVRSLAAIALPLVLAAPAHAQLDRFELEGYAIINYHKFDWQTDPQRRAAVDIERVAIEPTFKLSDKIKIEAEIEFEHGGTGSSMEFDKFEEFGEYEQEVEKGGEVVIEKLAAVIDWKPWMNFRVGHFYVPVGRTNQDYEPTEYFTVTRSESETSLVPATWHETGVQIFGEAGPVDYQLMVINGLDATGFSSSTWIALGHQGRFEMVNAENLAVAARVDWKPIEDLELGVSGYIGNSADNRPKPDMTVPATVSIGDFHGELEAGPLTVRGLVLYGQLQNAAEVSRANRNLSNNLNVKRSPVASAALGAYVEAGYDVFSFGSFAPDSSGFAPRLEVFGRYDYYDSMFEVPEGIFDNPRWERKAITAGLNYRPVKGFIAKADYSLRTLGIPNDNHENTFSLGMGIEF